MAQRYARRQLGDRADGRKLRTLPSTERLAPYIRRTRVDAEEHYRESVEVSALSGWLSGKTHEGLRNMELVHVVAAAFARTVAYCPYFNRFIAGSHIFARNDVSVSLLGIGETATGQIKAELAPSDTVSDVYHRILEQTERLKAGDADSAAERAAGFLMLLPRFLLRFGVQLVRLGDYYGIWGHRLLSASNSHCSVRIYDNARSSLRANSMPLQNFGNASVNITLGKIRTVLEPDESGKLIVRRWLDIDIGVDCRIAPKADIERAVAYWMHFMENPRELERAPKRILDDVN